MDRFKVFVNEVEFGSIAQGVVQRLRAEARRDKRLYVAQIGNGLSTVARLTIFCARWVPIVSFWLVAILCLVAREGMQDAALQIARDPIAFWLALELLLVTSVVITICVAAFLLSGNSKRFGFLNHFEDRVQQKIRRQLRIPVNEPVELVPERIFQEAMA